MRVEFTCSGLGLHPTSGVLVVAVWQRTWGGAGGGKEQGGRLSGFLKYPGEEDKNKVDATQW